MPMTVTLVRHGQTPHNLERKCQTRTDIKLSNIGVIQANILGEELCEEKFTRAYASNLNRAKSTAERILRNNRHQIPEIVEDARLRERDFGDWEGVSEDFLESESERLGIRVHRLAPPNGESYEEFGQNALNFFKDICQLMKEDGPPHHVLVVTHCGWLLTFIDNILKDPKTFHVKNLKFDDSARRVPDNTSVTRFQVEKAPVGTISPLFTLTFEQYFDSSHLKLT